MERNVRFPDASARLVAAGRGRDVLEASWQRSADSGVDRERPVFRRVDDAELARRLEASRALIDAAGPHLRWLSAALAPLPHVVALTDRDGILLSALGADAEAMARDGLLPGYDWSERQMGTNGAGTALAAGEPVAVVGRDHFCHAFAGLGCVAAPIRDPNGTVVGAIDLSTPTVDGDRQRLVMVAHVAHVIELHLGQAADADAAARAVERARRLEALMTALARARDVAEVAEAVMHDTVQTLGAAGGVVYALDEADALVLVGHGGDTSVGPRFPRLTLDERLHVTDAVRRRAPIWLHSYEEAVAAYPRLRGIMGAEALQALVAVPLVVADRCVGAVSFRFTQPRLFNEDERRFVLTATSACAQALDRARAQGREEDALAGRLRRVEGWLGRIYDSPLVGIVVTDGRRVLEANDAFLDLVGASRDELAAGLDWRRLTADESRVDDEHAFAAARFRGWCAPYEKSFVRKDGARVPVLLGAARLDDGQLACLIVDDRARHEAERFQRHVVGIVSHDLRGPVAAIELSAHAQKTRGGDQVALQLADNIISACRSMHQIIGDLLDYARTRSGGIPIVRRPCDVDQLCRDVVARCRQQFPGRVIALCGHGPVEGTWDAGRLMQLLSNLVTNALKHGAPDSPVTVEWAQGGDELLLRVHNEGEPIAEEQLPSIFEPFQRGRRAHANDRFGSVGLGLYIVREVARAHGGTVEVRSSAASGTVFTVRLPA